MMLRVYRALEGGWDGLMMVFCRVVGGIYVSFMFY